MARDLLKYTMTKPAIGLYIEGAVEPRAYAPNGQKPKPDAKKSYSGSFVLDADHPDVAGMKDTILKAAQAEWPGRDIKDAVAKGELKMPFTSGDKMIAKRAKKRVAAGKEADTVLDFLKGKLVFKASSDFPVALGVRVNGSPIDVTEDNKAIHKKAFYTGVACVGSFTYGPYTVDDKEGVKAYFDACFSFNSGPHLKIGGRSSADTFKGVAGVVVDTDPTAGAPGADDDDGDEIPF